MPLINRPNNPVDPNDPGRPEVIHEANNTSTDDDTYRQLDPDGYSENDPPNTDTETLNAW